MPAAKRAKKKAVRPSLGVRNRIRVLRFNRGEMTQETLAKRVGLTRQTIIAIEQGRYSPSLAAAFRIANALKVPFDEVFQFEE
jgi:putative transcriptional regulator